MPTTFPVKICEIFYWPHFLDLIKHWRNQIIQAHHKYAVCSMGICFMVFILPSLQYSDKTPIDFKGSRIGPSISVPNFLLSPQICSYYLWPPVIVLFISSLQEVCICLSICFSQHKSLCGFSSLVTLYRTSAYSPAVICIFENNWRFHWFVWIMCKIVMTVLPKVLPFCW